MRIQRQSVIGWALSILLILAGCGAGQTLPSDNESPPITSDYPVATAPQSVAHENPESDVRQTQTPSDPIDDLLGKMSLAEKIGQMVLVGMDGTKLQPEIGKLIKDRHVGGIILYSKNITSSAQAVRLLNALKQANRDAAARLPLLLSADQEGGRVSRLPKEITDFPSSMIVGDTNDTKYAYQVGASLGEAMKQFGFNMDFAPVLDVNTNPDNPVIGDRSFGAAADTVSRIGVQVMSGIQSQGVIPVVKHFPGHGDTSVDSHKGLPVVEHSLQRLRSIEFAPFSAAISEGAPVVMVGHILMSELDPNTPASMSRIVIQNYLRDELRFNGVVITDDMTMEAIGETAAIGPAAVQAVLAGADIVLVGHDSGQQMAVLDALMSAAQSGKLPQKAIDASVYRIVKMKQDFRLSDQPTATVDVEALNRHIEAALKR
ncbi:beta-N-acetylhexosaminidase [Paenibacillus thailandensis]|uniref:Beta-N-acetylhexosaminidase n=1 Tax=Paenibacillus thailandensis TaxID=393250 RepID=A0ABW5QUC2_9BACL